MKHPKTFDTDEETSLRMSKVKLKRGDAEALLAKKLWHKGYRYKYNDSSLPGSPDIAILKYRIAIFVDGEFWHGKDWEHRKEKLKRNRDYWIKKIEENMARDIRVDRELFAIDWIPVHFWSKDVMKYPDDCISEIENIIDSKLNFDTEMDTYE